MTIDREKLKALLYRKGLIEPSYSSTHQGQPADRATKEN